MPVCLARPSDYPSAMREISRAEWVGLDTEFHAERRWLPRLFLLQVQVPGGTTWLFDPLEDGGVRSLGDLLCDRSWVVHAGYQDMRILHAWFGRLPEVVHDTQIASGLLTEHYPEGFSSLLRGWLGRNIEKREQLSDWSRRPLGQEQLDYAAADVVLLQPLWEALSAALEARDRSERFACACRDARDRVISPVSPDEAWRSITGAPRLTREELAILQGLASWRRVHAEQNDMPERSVIGDGLLVQISRMKPTSLQDFKANRRMPKSVVRRHGEALVGVVGRALALPSEERPSAARYRTPEYRRLSWLRCFAESLGFREGWAAALVLPVSRLEQIVVQEEPTREVVREILGPWRDDVAGDELWSAICGSRSLSLSTDVTIGV